MATYQNGGVRSATENSVKAAQRSAANRRCPKCGRKSALQFYSDDLMYGTARRWPDCGHENMKMRDE